MISERAWFHAAARAAGVASETMEKLSGTTTILRAEEARGVDDSGDERQREEMSHEPPPGVGRRRGGGRRAARGPWLDGREEAHAPTLLPQLRTSIVLMRRSFRSHGQD